MASQIKYWLAFSLGIALFVGSVPSAWAQGLLVDVRPDHHFRLPRPDILPHPRPIPIPRPRPQAPQSYKIKELSVRVNLADQIAKVQVSQSFVNTGSRQMEVCFIFPLPYDGAVNRLTFLVDGKEYEAKLLAAKEAREIYEGYIRRNEDPALLEWIGSGMFKTSVFPVPPGAERTVTLNYSQVCRKSGGLTEFLFPLSTAKYTSRPVEKVSFQVNIDSQSKIKNVYSPTHTVQIARPSNLQARVEYEMLDQAPKNDFRLMYDVGHQAVGASVLSYRPNSNEDGYYMLLVSPEIPRSSDEVVKKNVVLVADRSGSMSGKKMQQAKNALKFVLNNLNKGDRFNIVAYDSVVESYKPELQVYDEQSRAHAVGFVEGMFAGGSTNIDGALKSALASLKDQDGPKYLIFLTDGQPTMGEKSEPKIVANAVARNEARARIFSLGVGYKVNSRLLDKLGRGCFGQTEYVRPDEDIEANVSKLYNRIGAPVLTDVAIDYDMEGLAPEQGSPVNRVYPRKTYDLFAGDQLVVVGRYRQPGAAKVTVHGSIGAAESSMNFPAQLTDISEDETYAFIEKLWAMRRIGEIIDEIDIHGKNQELVDEMVSLATKHGILTPYTSFLADENSDFRDLAVNRRQAGVELEKLREVAGRNAFRQRRAKGALQQIQAPAAAPADAFGGAALPGGLGGGGRGFAEEDRAEPGRAARPVREVLQSVGRKTFYQRGGKWYDSTLTEQQEKNVVRVKRYSKEYFDLIVKHGKEVAKYLAIEGEVVVVLDGQAYAF